MNIEDSVIILKNIKKLVDIEWKHHITDTELSAIETLLTAYEKEKEKNKTLETLLQGNLYQMYLYYKELAGRYQANSVSKDKIKAKIEECKKEKENANRIHYNYWNRFEEILQSLLEEKE